LKNNFLFHQHPQVGNPVHDEGLVGRPGRRDGGVDVPGHVGLVVPEADQQPRTDTDPFPSDEEAEIVVAHYQHQHREDEGGEVAEEAVEPLVVLHIAVGVDMNDRRDQRDHDHHDGRHHIDGEAEGDRHIARYDPIHQADMDGPRIVDMLQKQGRSDKGDEEQQGGHDPRQQRLGTHPEERREERAGQRYLF
jgi:hypothetical protein